eukprot:3893073-Rhodomonas_salina.2
MREGVTGLREARDLHLRPGLCIAGAWDHEPGTGRSGCVGRSGYATEQTSAAAAQCGRSVAGLTKAHTLGQYRTWRSEGVGR